MMKRFSWCGKKNCVQFRNIVRTKKELEEKKEWRIKLPARIDRSVNIIELASEFIEEELPKWEDTECNACELGRNLTEDINMMGYVVEDAWAFLSNHLKDARDEYEYEMNNYGSVLHNPFEEPDAFVTCIMINVVESIISQIPYIDKHWNEQIFLTKGLIRNILSHLYPNRY
jgi:hypothetical protein